MHVDAFTEQLDGLAKGEAWGAVVTHGDEVVCEVFDRPESSGAKWEIGSIRKSVCSGLLGVAIEEGRIALDTPVHEVWPEILELGDEKDRGIEMVHLATNTSGWMLDHGPGEQWVYNNAACTAGNAVVGRVFEMADDRIAPLVEDRIAGPLGLDWICYHYEESFVAGRAGNPGPKLAVDSTLLDLACFGRMWMRDGRHGDVRIVPRDYAEQARTNQCVHLDAHYGFWWFTNDGRTLIPDAPEDAFFHIGHGREHRRTLLIVIPSTEVVVAIGTHEHVFDVAKSDQSRPLLHTLFAEKET